MASAPNNVTPIKEQPTGLALLRMPFPENQISKLPKGNVMLDYVGHAALTDRLLDADPLWDWEPLAFDARGLPAIDELGGLWIKLTLCGKTRLGYGHAGAKKGGDAIKEVIGDALRNAAMRFGAALDLWHKGDLHVDDGEDRAEGSEMPDAEWAKLTGLIKATGTNVGEMAKYFGVAKLPQLNQDQYAEAVEMLNKKLAKLAKAETDAKAAPSFAEELGDDIPY